MARETRPRRGKTAAAFTLVELLLTVALMLLLAGAVIINFGSLDRNARLEEGAAHVETLFRFARAQAASTGRQVRILFGSSAPLTGGAGASTNQPQAFMGTTNAGVQVVWEPNPVEAPGRFESLPGAELLVEQVNDLVKVQDVHLPASGASSFANIYSEAALSVSQIGSTNGTASADVATTTAPPLNCYPDGSSDSLQVTFVSTNGEDNRLAVVTLSGMNGAAHHRMVAATDDGAPPSGEWFQAASRRDQ